MSLSANDLLEIRKIVKDEVAPIYDELEAIRNDINEIYDELSLIKEDVKEVRINIIELQQHRNSEKSFKKLSIEDKLLTLNSELLEAARQAGITLPR